MVSVLSGEGVFWEARKIFVVATELSEKFVRGQKYDSSQMECQPSPHPFTCWCIISTCVLSASRRKCEDSRVILLRSVCT